MSHQRRKSWPSSAPHARKLAVELLEDRRLLTVVNTLIDEADGSIVDGDVSLRDAVALAGDTITFAPALFNGGLKVISLALGPIAIGSSVTIQGPGANLLAIDATAMDPTPLTDNGDGSRVFTIARLNIVLPLRNVAISGLTLTGGDVNDEGGAIYNIENLTLSGVNITENAATDGGGIYHSVVNQANVLSIQNSTISGNVASNAGGGLYGRYGYIFAFNSTVSGNSAPSGGGVHNHANFAAYSSTISENAAEKGGGIFNSGALYVFHSTISENVAVTGGGQALGGGIFNSGPIANVNNSTVSGNVARAVLANSNLGGGGIHSSAGVLTVVHSTIANNRQATSGIFGASITGGPGISTTSVTLQNSIVAGNTSVSPAQPGLTGAADPSSSFNLLDDGGGLSNGVNGNLVGTLAVPIDANLGPLADNGGPTFTHALLTGSPAIDAGQPGVTPGAGGAPANDQRGAPFARVHNGRIDMGAFELQPPPTPSPSADFNSSGRIDGLDFLVWQRGNGATGAAATRANGNADNDTDVDAGDFAFWKSSFGNPAAIASASPALAAALTADDGSSALSPVNVDAALAYQQMFAEATPRRPYRPRLARAR